ncbi:MAG: magnesium/cobalt transporter CorA [Chloroflexota bacterium]|nr:magnesium/cobalt transporter CorA [Chloroflexota bacterium]
MGVDTITHGKITWTDISHPAPDDIAVLRRNFDFHPLDLEDCLSRIERPKIDEYETYLFIVMHFPIYDSDQRITRPSEVDFFIGTGYLVTVHDGVLTPLIQLFEDCRTYEATRAKHMGRGASRLLYSVIDALVDYCFPILDKVGNNIEALEDEIFTENMQRIVQEISVLRRDIIALRRIIKPQLAIVTNLERKDRPFIREELDVYFGDIVDHLNKAWDILEDHREVIEGLSETSDSVISYRINEVMKILTIISVVLLPLTLISGIYGMNILLPLAQNAYAFWLIAAAMVLISGGMLFYFRRRRWL